MRKGHIQRERMLYSIPVGETLCLGTVFPPLFMKNSSPFVIRIYKQDLVKSIST